VSVPCGSYALQRLSKCTLLLIDIQTALPAAALLYLLHQLHLWSIEQGNVTLGQHHSACCGDSLRRADCAAASDVLVFAHPSLQE
jgi:hypothetical protein